MRALLTALTALTVVLAVAMYAHGQEAGAASTTVLFQDVRVFDGMSDHLSGAVNVLVRGNRIERISAEPIPTDRRADTVVISGGGRTLMPGLIDAHWHAMLVRPTPAAATATTSATPTSWPAPKRPTPSCAASPPYAIWAGRSSGSSVRSLQ